MYSVKKFKNTYNKVKKWRIIMKNKKSLMIIKNWLKELDSEQKRLVKIQDEYNASVKRYDYDPEKYLKNTNPGFIGKKTFTSVGTLLMAGTLISAGPLVAAFGSVLGPVIVLGQLTAGWSLTRFAGLKQLHKIDSMVNEHKKFKNYNEYYLKKIIKNKELQDALSAVMTEAELSNKDKYELTQLKELLKKEELTLIAERDIVKIAVLDNSQGLLSYRTSVLIKNLNKNLNKDNELIGNFGVTLDSHGMPISSPNDGLQEIHNQVSFLNEKKKYILALLGGYPSEKEYFGRQKSSVFDTDNKELIKIIKTIKTLEQKQEQIIAEVSKENLIENKILIDETIKLKAEIERKDAELQQLKSEKETNQELYENIYRSFSIS